jgi:hypothetical protein
VGLYADTTPWIKGYNNCGLFMGNGLIASERGLAIGYNGAPPNTTAGAIIAGGVGIGTSGIPVSQTEMLTIIPAANPTTVSSCNQITVGEMSNNSAYRIFIGYGSLALGWSGSIQAIQNGVGTVLALNGNGGNVGIGTVSPSMQLSVGTVSPGSGSGIDGHVNLSAATLAIYSQAMGGPMINWNVSTNGGNANTCMARIQATMSTDSNFRLSFYTGAWNNNNSPGNPVMTMGNGYVVVNGKGSMFGNPSGPNAGAQVTDANILFYNNSSTNWCGMGVDTNGDFWLRTGTSGTPNPQFNVGNTGNVGIGTTSPQYVLHVNPDSAGKPGTSTWLVASDVRTKQRVEEMRDDSLALLRQLRWIRFQYNGLAELPQGMDCMGLEAQAVQAIIPEAVGTVKAKLHEEDEEKTDLLHISYHAIYVHMARAIQQLDERVQQLAALVRPQGTN